MHKKQLRNRMLYASQWKEEAPFDDMVFTTQKGMPIRYGNNGISLSLVSVFGDVKKKWHGSSSFTLE